MNAIRDSSLMLPAKVVAFALASRADRNGEAYPSLSTIAHDAGCRDERTVRKALVDLERCDVVRQTKRRGRATLFKFNDEALLQLRRPLTSDARGTPDTACRGSGLEPLASGAQTPLTPCTKPPSWDVPRRGSEGDLEGERAADPAPPIEVFEPRGQRAEAWTSELRVDALAPLTNFRLHFKANPDAYRRLKTFEAVEARYEKWLRDDVRDGKLKPEASRATMSERREPAAPDEESAHNLTPEERTRIAHGVRVGVGLEQTADEQRDFEAHKADQLARLQEMAAGVGE